MMRNTIIGILIFLAFGAHAQQTIFLVRHAEKVDSSRDPELSLAGKARAVRLMELLEDADIRQVYSTDYIRTQETARPLAEKVNLTISSYRPFEEGLIQSIKSKGGNALIVGHSNTIPSLVNQLIGQQKFQQLDDNEYSLVFVVTIIGDEATHYLLRF